jgi:hypothetical protein
MDQELEQSLGALIDNWYREQVSDIDLHTALVDYISHAETDAVMALHSFYHEDPHCDMHHVNFGVTLQWDGVTVDFLLKLIHQQFTAQVHYQSHRLKEYSIRIDEFSGSESALSEWIAFHSPAIAS